MEVPPRTDAAMAFISQEVPVEGLAPMSCEVVMMPTMAAQKPEMA